MKFRLFIDGHNMGENKSYFRELKKHHKNPLKYGFKKW